jgi:hypothetical protein
MSQPDEQPALCESTTVLELVDEIVDRFEAAWREGERPSIDDYLPGAGPSRRAVLVELVHADLEYRLGDGDTVRVEAYLARYPELGVDPTNVLDLFLRECELRCEGQARAPFTEYARRLQAYRAQLGQQARARSGESTPIPSADQARQPGPGAGGGSQPPGEVIPRPGQGSIAAPAVSDGAGGRIIPGYEILGELGRGAMGVIYQARQVKLNRLVAIKMILDGPHAVADQLERFRREAEAVARLQHPHIVQVYDFGEQEGRPFFAMELVEGTDLKARLDAGPLPPGQAAVLLQALAQAVHYAHEHGIIHRDLKPANVLLTRDGTPKVTDFGLAKYLEGDAGQTRSGAILGTPSYMAPEQAAGQTRGVGPLSDVYALGAILYELLTGRPPFRGATAVETLEQVRFQDPVPPSGLRPGVRRDLETICLKAMAKEPARRYASALELADDLARFEAGEPIRARREGLVRRLGRRLDRLPATLGFILAMALITSLRGVQLQFADRLASMGENLLLIRPGPAPPAF